MVAQGFALLCGLNSQGVSGRIIDDAVVMGLLDKLFVIGQAGLAFLGLIVLCFGHNNHSFAVLVIYASTKKKLDISIL